MTEVIDEGLIEYCHEEIVDAARRSPIHLYTPSVLQTAAEALCGIQTVIEEHAIADAFTRAYGPLPSRLLDALTERFAGENYFVDETIVDPVALLTTAVEFVCDHVDEPVAALEGPAMAESRAVAAYMVLPRLPATPAWGEDGNAPLVVTLGRPDRVAQDIVASSGAGAPWRDYDPGPWGWYLSHEIPGHWFPGDGTRVVAQAPSNETAGEVATVIAQVLTGELPLPR
ncbi:hypothetical protein SAMN05443665_10052 [Actinomadura meyerae]|uniref:Uncharacterized protein n=1 Tax=Actinomadura meyerae TaxID=240840 RepID=A0A239ETU6_9ACTN|nr:hypothetical protein [Actinomadura meyerae]SNS48180.1 hypothetical protein SAMN05443665_10052 [Actinomadura meyerae]